MALLNDSPWFMLRARTQFTVAIRMGMDLSDGLTRLAIAIILRRRSAGTLPGRKEYKDQSARRDRQALREETSVSPGGGKDS